MILRRQTSAPQDRFSAGVYHKHSLFSRKCFNSEVPGGPAGKPLIDAHVYTDAGLYQVFIGPKRQMNVELYIKNLIGTALDDVLENCYSYDGVLYYKELPSLQRISKHSVKSPSILNYTE